MLGIYIHVPFCGKKCDYCDFYSVSFNKNYAEEYVNAVLRNIRHYSDNFCTIDTIYFGGGTPSLLTPHQISCIISEIGKCFVLDSNAEITLETNPNTVSEQKLRELRNAGVNRISFGVQSMNNDELKLLGRSHSEERAEKAVTDANNAGFKNISCDLMISLPYQTEEKLEYSIKRFAELPIQHVSAYILKIEENTPFFSNGVDKICPDEDESAELYMKTVELLENVGFMQYEVSNFAKKGFESRHNSRYWKCLDYIGIGPSAHSCYKGKRFAVARDLDSFLKNNVQQTVVTDDAPCGFEERAMLALRLKEGLNLTETGTHRTSIEKKIPHLVKAGYAEFDGHFVSLTPKGFLMSNSVIEYLIFLS